MGRLLLLLAGSNCIGVFLAPGASELWLRWPGWPGPQSVTNWVAAGGRSVKLMDELATKYSSLMHLHTNAFGATLSKFVQWRASA